MGASNCCDLGIADGCETGGRTMVIELMGTEGGQLEIYGKLGEREAEFGEIEEVEGEDQKKEGIEEEQERDDEEDKEKGKHDSLKRTCLEM